MPLLTADDDDDDVGVQVDGMSIVPDGAASETAGSKPAKVRAPKKPKQEFVVQLPAKFAPLSKVLQDLLAQYPEEYNKLFGQGHPEHTQSQIAVQLSRAVPFNPYIAVLRQIQQHCLQFLSKTPKETDGEPAEGANKKDEEEEEEDDGTTLKKQHRASGDEDKKTKKRQRAPAPTWPSYTKTQLQALANEIVKSLEPYEIRMQYLIDALEASWDGILEYYNRGNFHGLALSWIMRIVLDLIDIRADEKRTTMHIHYMNWHLKNSFKLNVTNIQKDTLRHDFLTYAGFLEFFSGTFQSANLPQRVTFMDETALRSALNDTISADFKQAIVTIQIKAIQYIAGNDISETVAKGKEPITIPLAHFDHIAAVIQSILADSVIEVNTFHAFLTDFWPSLLKFTTSATDRFLFWVFRVAVLRAKRKADADLPLSVGWVNDLLFQHHSDIYKHFKSKKEIANIMANNAFGSYMHMASPLIEAYRTSKTSNSGATKSSRSMPSGEAGAPSGTRKKGQAVPALLDTTGHQPTLEAIRKEYDGFSAAERQFLLDLQNRAIFVMKTSGYGISMAKYKSGGGEDDEDEESDAGEEGEEQEQEQEQEEEEEKQAVMEVEAEGSASNTTTGTAAKPNVKRITEQPLKEVSTKALKGLYNWCLKYRAKRDNLVNDMGGMASKLQSTWTGLLHNTSLCSSFSDVVIYSICYAVLQMSLISNQKSSSQFKKYSNAADAQIQGSTLKLKTRAAFILEIAGFRGQSFGLMRFFQTNDLRHPVRRSTNAHASAAAQQSHLLSFEKLPYLREKVDELKFSHQIQDDEHPTDEDRSNARMALSELTSVQKAVLYQTQLACLTVVQARGLNQATRPSLRVIPLRGFKDVRDALKSYARAYRLASLPKLVSALRSHWPALLSETDCISVIVFRMARCAFEMVDTANVTRTKVHHEQQSDIPQGGGSSRPKIRQDNSRRDRMAEYYAAQANASIFSSWENKDVATLREFRNLVQTPETYSQQAFGAYTGVYNVPTPETELRWGMYAEYVEPYADHLLFMQECVSSVLTDFAHDGGATNPFDDDEIMLRIRGRVEERYEDTEITKDDGTIEKERTKVLIPCNRIKKNTAEWWPILDRDDGYEDKRIPMQMHVIRYLIGSLTSLKTVAAKWDKFLKSDPDFAQKWNTHPSTDAGFGFLAYFNHDDTTYKLKHQLEKLMNTFSLPHSHKSFLVQLQANMIAFMRQKGMTNIILMSDDLPELATKLHAWASDYVTVTASILPMLQPYWSVLIEPSQIIKPISALIFQSMKRLLCYLVDALQVQQSSFSFAEDAQEVNHSLEMAAFYDGYSVEFQEKTQFLLKPGKSSTKNSLYGFNVLLSNEDRSDLKIYLDDTPLASVSAVTEHPSNEEVFTAIARPVDNDASGDEMEEYGAGGETKGNDSDSDADEDAQESNHTQVIGRASGVGGGKGLIQRPPATPREENSGSDAYESASDGEENNELLGSVMSATESARSANMSGSTGSANERATKKQRPQTFMRRHFF